MASSVSEAPARPRIGVSTYVDRAVWGAWDRPAALVPYSYVEAVARAGGVPVLLPPLPLAEDGGASAQELAAQARAAVGGVEGLLLAGGADVDPSLYGRPVGSRTTVVHPGRDAWEIHLLEAAMPIGIPVLGVCRGAQVLNIAAGGSLVQHLPDVVGHDGHRPATGVTGAVDVTVEVGSQLHEVLGGSAVVPCYHHQSIDEVGTDLRAVAWAADGTVEAVEGAGPGFVLGVQWHPEEDLRDLRLLQALVRRASEERR